MKLLRFMSAAEALKLVQGKTVVNRADHHLDNQQTTNSVGFCFLIVDNRITLDTTAIYTAAQMLSGVTIMDICLVATVEKRPRRFAETWGHYRDGDMPELSAEKYSLRDFAEWKFFAPHDRSGLMPPFSGNWVNPVLTVRSKS